MQERTRRPEQRPRKYGPSQVAELTAVRASELGVFLDAETIFFCIQFSRQRPSRSATASACSFISIRSAASLRVCAHRA